MENMKQQAVHDLYPSVKQTVKDTDGNITAYDIDGNEVSIDMDAVETKATELQTEEDNKTQEQEDLKASARQKLIDGEPLTEDEAKTVVI